MLHLERSSRLSTLIIVLAGLIFTPNIFADDADDVMSIVYQYGDSENDLAAQAKLMRSDRVYISQGLRQTDQAKNMANQIAISKVRDALNGGKTKITTTIEGAVVSIHGDVAVASFVRWFTFFPHNQAPNTAAPAWVTLVLIKEGSSWLIKHTHQSPVGSN